MMQRTSARTSSPHTAMALFMVGLSLIALPGCLSFFGGGDDEEAESAETQKQEDGATTGKSKDEKEPSEDAARSASEQQDKEAASDSSDESFTPSEAIIGGIKKLHPANIIDSLDRTLDTVLPEEEQPKATGSHRELASLQTKVNTLEQEVLSLRASVASLKRAFRSGVFVPKDNLSFESMGSHQNSSQGLDLPVGKEPDWGEGIETEFPTGTQIEASAERAESPAELLHEATEAIERANYGQAVVLLEQIKMKYPGFADEGISDVLLAESWLALNAPEKALPPLDHLMGVFPSSSHLPRAKLTQAKAYAQLGEKQRSTNLLLEVIALSPDSQAADHARRELSLMRNFQ